MAEDDYLGKDTDEDGADIISGLHCKIVVQFEKYWDFYNTLKVLCCRSLQKVGSLFFFRYYTIVLSLEANLKLKGLLIYRADLITKNSPCFV